VASRRLSFRGKALTIACTDLNKSMRFYQKLLGAITVKTDDGIGCPCFRLGSFAITLMANATERTPAVFPTHAMPMIWLEVNDLDAASRRFAKAGVEVLQPSDGTFMVIADPDGLVIEVWQAEGPTDES
jgi:predicted enzyme related to lactoylglutathione lyase